jgi:hypothetical protein
VARSSIFDQTQAMSKEDSIDLATLMEKRWVVLILAFALVSCRTDTSSAKDSTSALATVQTVAPPDTAVVKGSPCQHTGLWAPCSVERRLKQAGFVVTKVDSVIPKRAGFSVDPIVYSLGKSRLEVFLYDNERAVEKDVAKLDTVRVVPTGSTATWEGTPTFIRSANLLAVLLTQNQRQAERVVLAITAGAPQPGSPR